MNDTRFCRVSTHTQAEGWRFRKDPQYLQADDVVNLGQTDLYRNLLVALLPANGRIAIPLFEAHEKVGEAQFAIDKVTAGYEQDTLNCLYA
jgi:hypothetical protein